MQWAKIFIFAVHNLGYVWLLNSSTACRMIGASKNQDKWKMGVIDLCNFGNTWCCLPLLGFTWYYLLFFEKKNWWIFDEFFDYCFDNSFWRILLMNVLKFFIDKFFDEFSFFGIVFVTYEIFYPLRALESKYLRSCFVWILQNSY